MGEKLNEAQMLAARIHEMRLHKRMGVTIEEITMGLIDFANAQDTKGVKNLFDAICGYKTAIAEPEKTPATIRRETIEEIDFVSKIANEVDMGHGFGIAVALVQISMPRIGRVTTFCRESIGYNPANFEN